MAAAVACAFTATDDVQMTGRTVLAVGRTVLAVGPPAALAWWAGWPLPTRWPDRQQVELWLAHPLTPDTAAVAGWLAWAVVVYAAVVRPHRRLRDAVQAAQSLGGLAVLLVGLPAGLIWWAGWPLPTTWPTGSQVQRWLAEPLTWPTIVAATAATGWLLWAALLYTVMVELVTRLGRVVRWLPRPPIPTPLQGLVGGLFGAAALAMNTPTASAAVAVDVGLAATAEQPLPGVFAPSDGTAAVKAVRPSAGVDLPDGGWLADPLADVVAGAATFTWWQRRHHYQPRPPTGAARSDPDLAPLPPTVAAIQAARQPADPTGPPTATATPHTALRDLVVVGARGARPVHVGDLPAGGVGLTGPGAADAGRGILAAHLLTAPLPSGQPRLVTTTTDLQGLFGGAATGPLGNVQVAGGLSEAVSAVERALLARTSNGRDPVGPAGAGVVGEAGWHPLVLLTTAPADVQMRSRLAVLLTLGRPLNVIGVLLGDWPVGTCWQIEPDGTVPDPAGTAQRLRLTVLATTAARDLLSLARQANGQPPPAVTPDPAAGAAAPAVSPPGHADAGDGPRLRLKLLGPVSILAGGRSVVIGRSAGLQILVLLALHPAGLTSGQLAEAIWPNLRSHLAAGRFHTTVSELRRTLHAATGGEVVTRSAGRYHLDTSLVGVDLWRLREQIVAAGTAHDLTDRDTALRAVVDAYGGELAAGEQWPWLAPDREAVRRDVIDAYTALAAAHPDQAVYLLPAATRIDPLNAHLHRQAVAVLTAAGDHVAVAALTDSHARHLAAAGLTPPGQPNRPRVDAVRGRRPRPA